MKNKNLFAFFLLLLSLANIVAHYVAGSPIQSNLFNSDALYLPTLFSDVFQRDGSLKDWFLTPSPYFFPDYPIFLMAYLTGLEPYSQIILFSLFQAVLTFAAVWLLAKRTVNFNPVFTALTILITFIWLALTSGEPFALFLNSAYHYGAFLVAVVFIALWIQYNDKNKWQNKAVFCSLVASLAFFSTVSDNLFLVQVIVPLIATTILVSIVDRDFSLKAKFPLILATAFSVLGSASYKLVVVNQTRYSIGIGFEKASVNLKSICELFYSALEGNLVFGALFVFYLGVVLYSFISILKGAEENKSLSWIAVFSFLSLCTTLATVLLVTNLPVTNRYLIPALSWPVIVAFIFLSNYRYGHFFFAATVTSLLATASLSWDSYQLIEKNGIKTRYSPSDLSCIDDVLEREGLTSGIAQYWDAKYLQMFSRLDLNIAQHYVDLGEMHWITSKEYFRKSYDFAIISEKAEPPYKISSEALGRLNGAPKLVRNCGGRLVYVYGKDKLRVRKIVSAGDSYTWKACELPTIIGERTAECEIQKKNTAQSGYLTFGPYEQLPAGQYVFEIAYSSTASAGDIVGSWDVALALPKEAKILERGLIAGANGASVKVTGKFDLSSEQNMEKIEIRTLARQSVDLNVIHIRIERVQ